MLDTLNAVSWVDAHYSKGACALLRYPLQGELIEIHALHNGHGAYAVTVYRPDFSEYRGAVIVLAKKRYVHDAFRRNCLMSAILRAKEIVGNSELTVVLPPRFFSDSRWLSDLTGTAYLRLLGMDDWLNDHLPSWSTICSAGLPLYRRPWLQSRWLATQIAYPFHSKWSRYWKFAISIWKCKRAFAVDLGDD